MDRPEHSREYLRVGPIDIIREHYPAIAPFVVLVDDPRDMGEGWETLSGDTPAPTSGEQARLGDADYAKFLVDRLVARFIDGAVTWGAPLLSEAHHFSVPPHYKDNPARWCAIVATAPHDHNIVVFDCRPADMSKYLLDELTSAREVAARNGRPLPDPQDPCLASLLASRRVFYAPNGLGGTGIKGAFAFLLRPRGIYLGIADWIYRQDLTHPFSRVPGRTRYSIRYRIENAHPDMHAVFVMPE
jgi:hypothetical protein